MRCTLFFCLLLALVSTVVYAQDDRETAADIKAAEYAEKEAEVMADASEAAQYKADVEAEAAAQLAAEASAEAAAAEARHAKEAAQRLASETSQKVKEAVGEAKKDAASVISTLKDKLFGVKDTVTSSGIVKRVKDISPSDAKKIAAGVLGVWGVSVGAGWLAQNINKADADAGKNGKRK